MKRIVMVTTAALLALVTALEFTRPVYAATINISGNIAVNTTWSAGNVYRLVGDTTIQNNVTLTIEPGTVVKFDRFSTLYVDGNLTAVGTSGQRIYFTSERDDSVGGDTNGDGPSVGGPGQWELIEFHDSSDDASLIEYATIRHGGCCESHMLLLQDASPTIRNTIITSSDGTAVRLEAQAIGSAAPTFDTVNFLDNDSAAISADVNSLPVLSGNITTGNGINGLLIRGGIISGDINWDQTSMTYVIGSDISVPNAITLTIAPGLVVKFDRFSTLYIDGKLTAVGTPSQRIYLTSVRDDGIGGDTDGDGANSGGPGQWEMIEFHENSDDDSLVEYATIRFGGCCEEHMLFLQDASPTIRNSIISFSDGDAVRLESQTVGSTAPSFETVSFLNNDSAAISADVNSSPNLTANTTTGNGTNGLLIRGGTIANSQTWNQTSMTYRIDDDIAIANGATLTVVPGMVVKFNRFAQLSVDGKLTAAGTAGQHIYFTSENDDNVGGNTNGGGASSGGPGQWELIAFHDSSDDASLIEYATIRYGGCCNGEMVLIQDASPTIRNSVIASSDGDGIVTENSTPQLICNNIATNENNGLRNLTPLTIVNAVNQYWGSATGPFHSVTNPGGQGNDVSDGVTFIPWKTVSCALSFSHGIFLPVILR